MKRILSLLLVVVMCLGVCSLAGCQLTPGTGAATTTPGTTEPTTPPVDVLAQAKYLLRDTYKGNTAPKADYKLAAQVVVAGVAYPVTWEISTDAITISAEPVDGFYLVDVPATNEVEIAYTLTATITAGDQTDTVTFERTLPVFTYTPVTEPEENTPYKLFMDQITLQQMFYALAVPSTTENKYINSTNDPKAAADYFAEKVDGGYKFYTVNADGDKLYVNPNLVHLDGGKISKFLSLSASTEAVFYYNETKLAWCVALEGTEYYMGTYSTYNTFSISESSYLPSETSFPGGFLTKADAEAMAPSEPPVIEIPGLEGATKPEAGKAYLAGMAKNDNVYYLTGAMNGYYMATVTTTATAVNFYVEEVTGGYNLYAMVAGSKLYVNAVVSGTHINGVYEAAASSVWTWNEDLFTFETQVNGAAYILGTGALTNYTTVGPVKADGENNYIQFVPSTNPDQEPPSGQPITIPEALALEDGAAVVVKGTVTEINTPWNDGYGNITVTIADEDGNTLYIYRLATKVELGDVITVTGVMGSYNGSKQVAAGATAEIEVAPTVITTIPEALEAEDGTAIKIQGTVTEINTPWNDGYGNITVTIADEDGNTLYVYRLATKVAVGDKITVTGVMGSYNGSRQVAAGATATIDETAPVDPNPTVITTISEALAAADGANVKLVGTVAEINTPWNEQYGNISVTITDGTNTLYIYRMSTKVNVGDKIEVTGVMATYNDARQIAQGSTATILEKAPVQMTIPEALEAADGTGVIVKGTVKEINTAWNEQYGNITVTIEDADGNTLYVYRLATNVAVGDNVIITGKMGTYNDARQIAAGATAEIVPVQTTSSLLAKFDFPAPAGKTGHIDGTEMTGKSYTNGNYTLSITASKVYYDAQDATGKGALKFGTSKAIGYISFTVPENVDYIIVYIAGYKANNGKYAINGGETYTTTTLSNDGEYEAVRIDTSTNKYVHFSTVATSYRIMMSCIEFYGD